MDIPSYLRKGALVKVQYWVGEIEDVCVSDTRIMVLVSSPKGIWRNHPAEWLEYQEGQIVSATGKEAIESINVYIDRVHDMLDVLTEQRIKWIECQEEVV